MPKFFKEWLEKLDNKQAVELWAWLDNELNVFSIQDVIEATTTHGKALNGLHNEPVE